MLTANETLLLEMLRGGKINLDVLEAISDMKHEKVNIIHGYTITPPKTDKGRWQTFVKDNDKGRKKVSANSEEKLYQKLYDHYFVDEVDTIEALYPEWMEKRKHQNVSDYTIRKNENHWKKHYAAKSITRLPVRKITADMIEEFFYREIREHDMTVKDLMNVKFIMKDIMRLAKRKKMLRSNPFDEVVIKTHSCRPPHKQSASKKVFLAHEKDKLFTVMNRDLAKNPQRTDAYAIFLMFKLGLRIGEVVALKYDDVDFDSREVHIHRMESKQLDEEGKLRPVIVDYVKKKSVYGDRYLPLSDYELEIFDTVMRINSRMGYKDDNFIFVDEESRTSICELDYWIRKYCMRADMAIKSAHDIRRTVASELYARNIQIEYIQEYLGHSSVSTTRSYIYDLRGKAQKDRLIIESLSDLNGLKKTDKEMNKKILKAL